MRKYILLIALISAIIRKTAAQSPAVRVVPHEVFIDSAFYNFRHANYHHAIQLYKIMIAKTHYTYDNQLLALCYARMDSTEQEKRTLEIVINSPPDPSGIVAGCCGTLADLYLKEKGYSKALFYYNLYGVNMKYDRMPDKNMLAYNLGKENARSECFEGLKMIDSAVDILTPYIFCTYKDLRDINRRYNNPENIADSLKNDSICKRYLTLLENLHTKGNIKAELMKADSGFYYNEKLKNELNDYLEKDVTCGFTFYGTDIIYTTFGLADTPKEKLIAETQTPFYTKAYQLQSFRQLPLCKMIRALPYGK
jgi:hypothetical protein